eukprot:535323-Amphidinium_carterae.2
MAVLMPRVSMDTHIVENSHEPTTKQPFETNGTQDIDLCFGEVLNAFTPKTNKTTKRPWDKL